VFTCSASLAQIWVGPKIGLQLAKAVPDQQERRYGEKFTSSYKPGYTFGLDVNYEVNRTFSLETGLLYSRKGKIITQQALPNQQNAATYHHLDLPLLLRTTFGRGFRQWYLNAGANVSYWLAGRGSIQADGVDRDYRIRFSPGISQREDIYLPNANRLQFGLDFGAGLIFKMGPYERLSVDFKYTLGQTDLSQSATSENAQKYFDRFRTTNHVISISTAYQFKINTGPSKKRK
jgi:long-subunit fatty acid transport protein